MNQNPKIAFLGTPDIARVFLDALIAANMSPTVVVTNPDKPVGREQTLTPSSVKVSAHSHNIPVLQPETIDDVFIAELSKEPWDLFIVVAYGMILPQALIDIPKHGTLNVHFSLLPRWRGASPVEAAILAGDTETGVAIQRMRFKLDSGPIVAQEKTAISEYETAPELRTRLGEIGSKLLIDTLPHYLADEIALHEQDESLVTKAAKMKKEDGELLLSDDAITKWRKYRAYKQWPGTFFVHEKSAGTSIRVKITDASFENGVFTILRVIPEGKREMNYEDFIRA